MQRQKRLMVRFWACLAWAGIAQLQSAVAQPTNLAVAPGGTATASSVGFGLPPENANNGNRAGDDIWHSVQAAVENEPHWYEIDLGDTDVYLDRVQIIPRGELQDTVKNFKIEVFDSGDTLVFTQPFLADTSTGDAAWGTNALRNVQGSRVRLTREMVAVGEAMTFAEFEVWGQSVPILENLALGRPVTGTPGIASGGPELAVDGNVSGNYAHGTVYHSDTAQLPWSDHFWQVELENESAISYINIFNRSDYTGNSSGIQLSILAADGVTVVESVDTTLNALDLGAHRYDLTHLFPGNPVGKYVRIDNLEPDGFILAFGEVEVFGVAVPEPSGYVLAVAAFVIYGAVSRRRALNCCA